MTCRKTIRRLIPRAGALAQEIRERFAARFPEVAGRATSYPVRAVGGVEVR